jgi:hypothetical protein
VPTLINGLHELANLSAWTGLSVAAVVLLIVAAYYLPFLRVIAVALAAAVTVGYFGGVYMHQVGRAEVKSEWDAANERVAAEAQARDQAAARSAANLFNPTIAARDKEVADLKTIVRQYETRISKLRPCPLGADALRLRMRHGRH